MVKLEEIVDEEFEKNINTAGDELWDTDDGPFSALEHPPPPPRALHTNSLSPVTNRLSVQLRRRRRLHRRRNAAGPRVRAAGRDPSEPQEGIGVDIRYRVELGEMERRVRRQYGLDIAQQRFSARGPVFRRADWVREGEGDGWAGVC